MCTTFFQVLFDCFPLSNLEASFQRMLRCCFCNRANFKSQQGLTQHQNHGLCHTMLLQERGLLNAVDSPRRLRSSMLHDQGAGWVHQAPKPPQKKDPPTSFLQDIDNDHLAAITMGMGRLMDDEIDEEVHESEEEVHASNEDDNDSQGVPLPEEPEVTLKDPLDNVEGPITTIRNQFYAYVQEKRSSLKPEEETSIKLLHLLKKKGTPLNTYPEVMEWHFKESGAMLECDLLKDCRQYVSREVMMKRLKARYNMGNKYPYRRKVKLPVSKTVVRMTVHDAGSVIQALLTDPRIKDDEYCFFGDNPLAPPPSKPTHISELMTASAFRDTYKKRVDKDLKMRQQLLPLVLYIDGSAVSHFHDMEVIPVKVSLGIFKRETRTKPHAWRVLGYIEKVHEQGGRGRELWRKSNLMEVVDGEASDEGDSDLEILDGVGDHNKQDLHAMIGVAIDGLKPLFDRGFLWDQRCKGVLYKNVHYLPFIIYVKCDNKEAEDMCQKYGMRQGNVKNLCRYCDIPMKKGDRHLWELQHKTEPQIKRMVVDCDLEGLRNLSQHFLWNAFWDLPFNAGNKRGIHGACPMDMLHTIQLGIFKYMRNIFFERFGPKSVPAKDINGLSKEFGRCFARQADSSIPNATFSKDIQEGKTMGKEYRGVLLLMLVILHCEAGKAILQSSIKGNFKEAEQLLDWALLVELLLLWEAYLLEPEMEVKDIKALGDKNRYIMYLIRRVASRKQGMQLKLMKFHAILHIVCDILLYGVPSEGDTSSNEEHHKPMKKASRLTQRAHNTFNLQTGKRMVDFEVIDFAMLELSDEVAVWMYFDGLKEEKEIWEDSSDDSMEVEATLEGPTGDFKGPTGDAMDQDALETVPCDAMIDVWRDEETWEAQFTMITSSMYKDSTKMNGALVDWLVELQETLNKKNLLPNRKLRIYTRIKRGGESFRGHPNYRGLGPWRDWEWYDFGTSGKFLMHMWCFVLLPDMKGERIKYGGIVMEEGVFALA